MSLPPEVVKEIKKTVSSTAVAMTVAESMKQALERLCVLTRRLTIEEAEALCREVAERGAICDIPEVLARLHDNEAYACAAAIRQLEGK